MFASRLDGDVYLVVRLGGASSCVSEGDTEQVVEGLIGSRAACGRLQQCALVRRGRGGRVPVKCALAKVRGNLKPLFEGANTVPYHGVGVITDYQ